MKRRDFLGMCMALLGMALVRSVPVVGLSLPKSNFGYCERGIREGVYYQTFGNSAKAVTYWYKVDGTTGMLNGTIDMLENML